MIMDHTLLAQDIISNNVPLYKTNLKEYAFFIHYSVFFWMYFYKTLKSILVYEIYLSKTHAARYVKSYIDK